LEEVASLEEPKIDPNLLIYDFEKTENHKITHAMYSAVDSLGEEKEEIRFFQEDKDGYFFD